MPPCRRAWPARRAARGATTDAHRGAVPLRRRATKLDGGPQHRMQRIERMKPKQKRRVLQILDALVERDHFRVTKG